MKLGKLSISLNMKIFECKRESRLTSNKQQPVFRAEMGRRWALLLVHVSALGLEGGNLPAVWET